MALNFAYNAALRLRWRGELLEELRLASLVTTVSVLGGLLALEVVGRTTSRQEARATALRTDIVARPA